MPLIDSWYTCTIASLEHACLTCIPTGTMVRPQKGIVAWSYRVFARNGTEATPSRCGLCAVPWEGENFRNRPTQTLPSGASGSGRTPQCASRAQFPRRSGSYSRHPSAPRTCAGCRRQCTQVYARRSARAHRAALDEEAVAASDSTLPFVRSHHSSYEQLCQEEPGAARVGR